MSFEGIPPEPIQDTSPENTAEVVFDEKTMLSNGKAIPNLSKAEAQRLRAGESLDSVRKLNYASDGRDGSDSNRELTAEEKKYLDLNEFKDSWVKIKVAGEEKEMPLQEAIRLQSLESATWKKMHEAAAKNKELEKKLSDIENLGIEDFFKMKGIDVAEFSEKQLKTMVEEMNMTPEEREVRQRLRKLEEYEQKEAQRKQEEEQKQAAFEQEAYLKESVNFLADAVSSSGLKPDPMAIKIGLSVMEEALAQDIELTKEQAASIIKERMFEMVPKILGSLQGDPSLIKQALGEDLVNLIRKSEFDRVTPFRASPSEGKTMAESMDSYRKQNPVTRTVAEYRKYYGLE